MLPTRRLVQVVLAPHRALMMDGGLPAKAAEHDAREVRIPAQGSDRDNRGA
jgi:hypothetical protein